MEQKVSLGALQLHIAVIGAEKRPCAEFLTALQVNIFDL